MPVAVAIIIALITLINSWHVISQAWINPPNHFFIGIAHYFADYFLYISQIAQGAHGWSLFARHQFTNEPMPPTWIYWFNVMLGKFHINPFLTYDLAIIIESIIVLTLIWYMLRLALTYRTTQYIAFIFITTASNFFDFATYLSRGTYAILGDFWFSPTPALNRLGGVPHQLFQTMLLLFVILVFTLIQSKKLRSTWAYVLLAILSTLAASTQPIQMLLVALTITTIIGWHIYKKDHSAFHILLGITALVPALVSAVTTNFEFARQPILAAAKVWEDAQQFHISIPQFIWALGPISGCLPIGLFALKHEKKPLLTSLLIYSGYSVVCFFTFIPSLLHTSPTRWISPASYMGIAILAALGFSHLAHWIQKNLRIASNLFYSIGIVIYILCTIPSLVAQVQARSIPLTTDSRLIALNHIPNDSMVGFEHIRNTSQDGVVLTDPSIPYDVIVPTLTGKISFTGHPVHTLYLDVKEQLRQRFFSGGMTIAEAQLFMINHGIIYILSTPNHESLLRTYPFLTKLFTNDAMTIYIRSL